MPRSSDREVIRGGSCDSLDDLDDLDLPLSAYSTPSVANSVYTNNSDGDEEQPSNQETSADSSCDQTVTPTTFISRDLLMLPEINHVIREEKAIATAADRPEQPRFVAVKKKKNVSSWECGGACPRFLRKAPIWLKICMALAVCTILFGFSLYLGARILQSAANDDNSSNATARQEILDKSGGLLQWQDTRDENVNTAPPTVEATLSLEEWAEGLRTSPAEP